LNNFVPTNKDFVFVECSDKIKVGGFAGARTYIMSFNGRKYWVIAFNERQAKHSLNNMLPFVLSYHKVKKGGSNGV
jgi:hypothetical protein